MSVETRQKFEILSKILWLARGLYHAAAVVGVIVIYLISTNSFESLTSLDVQGALVLVCFTSFVISSGIRFLFNR
ncbi:hypothetical protein O6D91_20860 [Cronobacter sakazakii]|uniref:hypothetical protein n=1 Tax=Cronobacter sakazakii TaxID=28141 RepID=UPI0009BA0F62|nr:hypothetical protein [Cronobacter sakazakii]MCZ6132158.1 hypothetical protein [Cronobacter sakazakii]MCZ6139919.1 hypothetical protein [Cronobacter sakazakii]PUX81482.1 hypothetical protein BTK64_19950 [Cronobacter sakazakii]